jgi:hypothetical protein
VNKEVTNINRVIKYQESLFMAFMVGFMVGFFNFITVHYMDENTLTDIKNAVKVLLFIT